MDIESQGCHTAAYRRRRPEQTARSQVVQQHLETYLALGVKTTGTGGACRPEWNASSAATSNAASSPMASRGPDFRTAAITSWLPSRAKVGCVRRATPGQWRRPRRIWWLTFSHRFRCASGPPPCPNACAGTWSASRRRSAPCCTARCASSRRICAAAAAHDRAGLERLLCYSARPLFALERQALLDYEHVAYRLPKPQRDGTTALTLTPLELLDHLAALIPPPKRRRHRYHGVLAPYSRLRADATPYACDLTDDSSASVQPA